MNDNKGNIIVLVGPSGVGKGTTLRRVFEQLDRLVYSVSATTRPMRQGELEGRDYFFKSKAEFEHMIAEEQLLEWAKFIDNYYGTPRDYLENQVDQGLDVLLEIELLGARQIREKKLPNAIFIFMAPPSIEELQRRLEERSTEKAEAIQARLEKARIEIQAQDEFDYVLVNENGKIEQTAAKLIEIIQTHRQKVEL